MTLVLFALLLGAKAATAEDLVSALSTCLISKDCPTSFGSYVPKNWTKQSSEVAKKKFDAWLCGLPVESATVPRLEPTLGKTILLLARELSTTLSQKRRWIDGNGTHTWNAWLPTSNGSCWFRSDICRAATNGTDPVPRVAQRFHSADAKHILGLWRAGQLIRLLTTSFLGDCAETLVDALPVVVEERGGISNNAMDIAVHVRRGDACRRYDVEEHRTRGRLCYSGATYASAIEALRNRYDPQRERLLRLRIASDSPSGIDDLIDYVRQRGENVSVFYINYDRILVGGTENATYSPTDAHYNATARNMSQYFIEHRNEREDVEKDLAMGSLYAEINLLKESEYFIGSAESAVTRLLLLAMIGHLGAVPPFIFVDEPTFLKGGEDKSIWRHSFDKYLGKPQDLTHGDS